jgi:hypothetical protein
MWILVIRVIIPLLKIPYAPWMNYLAKITDPVINFFKKRYPIHIDKYDFSVLIPLAILFLVQIPITDLMIGGANFSFLYVLSLIIRVVKILLLSLFLFFIISSIVLLYFNINNRTSANPLVLFINKLFTPIMGKIKSLFKIKSEYADRYSLIIIIICLLVIFSTGYFLLNYFLNIVLAKNSENFLRDLKMMEEEIDIR